jgi:hypothetical protein
MMKEMVSASDTSITEFLASFATHSAELSRYVGHASPLLAPDRKLSPASSFVRRFRVQIRIYRNSGCKSLKTVGAVAEPWVPQTELEVS